jgi:hypothetical protein
VLLTRSRLCPRPKPGSSLHLHVLGTPPAFVLSQDQTLREELPQRVVRGTTRLSVPSQRPRSVSGQILGPSLVGSDPCAHSIRRRFKGRRCGARVHRWAPGRKTGSIWHRRSNFATNGVDQTTASNLWTHSSTEVRSKGAHAVEFSKTVAPFKEGFPPETARPGAKMRSRGGPTRIALETGLNQNFG